MFMPFFARLLAQIDVFDQVEIGHNQSIASGSFRARRLHQRWHSKGAQSSHLYSAAYGDPPYCNRALATAVIDLTPVEMVGSGSGRNIELCGPGSDLPAAVAAA